MSAAELIIDPFTGMHSPVEPLRNLLADRPGLLPILEGLEANPALRADFLHDPQEVLGQAGLKLDQASARWIRGESGEDIPLNGIDVVLNSRVFALKVHEAASQDPSLTAAQWGRLLLPYLKLK